MAKKTLRLKSEFRRLSPSEIAAGKGLSTKKGTKNYLDKKTGLIYSNRAYVKATTGETFEQRQKKIRTGKRKISKKAPKAARQGRIVQAAKKPGKRRQKLMLQANIKPVSITETATGIMGIEFPTVHTPEALYIQLVAVGQIYPQQESVVRARIEWKDESTEHGFFYVRMHTLGDMIENPSEISDKAIKEIIRQSGSRRKNGIPEITGYSFILYMKKGE